MSLPNDKLLDVVGLKQAIVDGDLNQKSGSVLPVDSPLCPDFEEMGVFVDLDTTTYVSDGYSLDRCATLGKIEFQQFIVLEYIFGVSFITDVQQTGYNSLSDDGTIMVVRNFVFKKTAGVWSLFQTLTQSVPQAGDDFGSGFSMTKISGNKNIIAIGSYARDVSGRSNVGQITVYRFNGTNWVEETTLEVPSGELTDNTYLGAMFDISADGNHIIVGLNTTVQNDKIYDYEYTTSWDTGTFHANPAGVASGDNFGASLKLSSDGSVLLISASSDDDINNASGALYVLERDGSNNWVESLKITDVLSVAHDYYGQLSEINADGSVIVISKHLRNAQLKGVTHIFRNNGTTWVKETELISDKISSGGAGYGGGVLSDDGNTLAISLTGSSDPGSSWGQVDIWKYSNSNWTLTDELFSTNLQTRYLGQYLDMSGNGKTVAAGNDSTYIKTTYIFDA